MGLRSCGGMVFFLRRRTASFFLAGWFAMKHLEQRELIVAAGVAKVLLKQKVEQMFKQKVEHLLKHALALALALVVYLL